MKSPQCWWWLGLGVTLGALAMSFHRTEPRQAFAANDRHEDYILCTGKVQVAPNNIFADSIWMLDYRAGKLLGTVVDRNMGKILPWKEVDLVQVFKIAPKQNVHFVMTTGNAVNGQTALYVAETQTGAFAVFTIAPVPDPRGGVVILQHEATRFRRADP